jgi:uncharacterized protein (TIGR02466 family)
MQHNLLQLFPIPFYSSKVNVSSLDKQNIKKLNYKRIDSNNGYISVDTKVLDNDIFESLKKEIENHVGIYTRNVLNIANNTSFYITNSWVMKHIRGDSAHRHHHTNSIFSGTVYIQTDNDSGIFSVYKTYTNVIPKIISPEYNEWNIFNCESSSFIPQNNDIFLFPSNLDHEVSQCNSSDDRYCLAFNVFLKGTLGQSDKNKISDLVI